MESSGNLFENNSKYQEGNDSFHFLNISSDHFNWSHETSTDIDGVTVIGPRDELFQGSLGFGDLALVSLFCSIIAGTVAGNTLVIAAVLTTRRLRTVTNCFVMSLAIADWLVGVFVMPPKVALHLVHNEWKLGGFFCEVWIALDILLCTASILSLCAISIDRYLAITRPLAYSRRRRSKRLALSMIFCVWVAATIITSPPIFGWYDETRNVENKCEYNENPGYVVYSALGSFFLPLLVMLYVYARIACVIARRQNSIQRLSNASDKRTQCYGRNELEEPLRGQSCKDIYEGVENIEGDRDPGNYEEGQEAQDAGDVTNSPSGECGGGSGKTSCIWGIFRLRSCIGSGGEDESHSGNETKRSSSGGQKSSAASSDSDSNSATGLALALPDPATLNGSMEHGNMNMSGDPGSGMSMSMSRSACSSPRHGHGGHGGGAGLGQQHMLQSHSFSRTRTGSRLCHHSAVTTSPQRNIHRVHQATSSTTRLFLDHELVPLDESKSLKISKSAPRVWTVEETSHNSLNVGRDQHRHKNYNGRTASLRHERNGRSHTHGHGHGHGHSHTHHRDGMGQTLAVPTMGNTPAGNPASIMSSPSITSGSQGSGRHSHTSSSRTYHQGQQNNYQRNPHTPTPTNMTSMVHRGRSIKLTLNVQGNDHKQNGSSIARDFSSGRVASFKRETKTAQTLAAVVGGFIICWLPFFVAYVIGPFLPSSDEIPTALMDALIWLGWGNSTINPFIYAFYSPDFRSAFWRLTVRKCSILLGRNRNAGHRSPSRRFDDHNNTHSRVST